MKKGEKHFDSLDGLRGVASLMVVVGHATAMQGPTLVPRKLLAVQFFFMLSGFVIAHAYEKKLAGGLTFAHYMARRVIRLYPLIVVGAALGLGAFTVAPPSYPMSWPILRTVTSALVIPHGLAGFWPNPPEWSLFFEMLAYVLYAVLLFRLPIKGLIIFIVPMTAAETWVMVKYTDHIPFALHLFGALGSFAIGVLLKRAWEAGLRVRVIPDPAQAIMVVALCVAPRSLGPLLDILAVLLIFPLVILNGAALEGRKIDRVLGELSFPLYILHWPVLVVCAYWLPLHGITGTYAAAAGTALAVALAWITLSTFDRPVRAWLTDGIIRRARQTGST